MAGRWIGYLLALGGAALFYCFYDQWFSGYLLALLLCLPWLSLLCSLPAMLTARIEARQPGSVMRSTGGRLELWCVCPLPAPGCRLRLVLTNAASGERTVRRVRLTKRPGLALPLPTEHCGVLLCRAERVRVYDYMGLFFLPRRGRDLGQTAVWPIPTSPEPPPKLLRHAAAGFHPKAGGGFAEHHELRGYLPGDSLRSIHWKLTSKLDQVIVREPMELRQDPVVLTLDLPRDPGERDGVLDRLAWVSRLLLEQEQPHEIRYLDSRTGRVVCRSVENPQQQRAVLEELLTVPPARGSIGSLGVRASWRYHIAPGKEAQT